ncbi:uncharacterized protein LOC114962765 [Acropora millepora]|uniref:uncharacterized protein LOC114962765 n=1 Tax=Acropora millepora TaxID=45264 RepID=UPI001CF35AD2|nr:uncharacterized protein LOC114962765 [Acropora millepora]
MTGRTSRTQNIPARLREETWYLVEYEDDEKLRVVHEEIRHIFSEDEEDEIQPGDIVSAIWTPNGQYYDAKVLKAGDEREDANGKSQEM